MKFVCEHCKTRYSIADEKVRQKLLKIRCKTCDNVLTLGGSSASGGAVAPAKPAAAARPPASAVPPVPPPPGSSAANEPVEWHLAVDGQQMGPMRLSDLARRILATPAQAEAYVWKDGFSGWKEPEQVALVARRLADLRSARQALAPAVSTPPLPNPPPAARRLPGAGAASVPVSPAAASLGAPPSVTPEPDADAFDNEATQIQPLSAAMLSEDAVDPAQADGEKAAPAAPTAAASGVGVVDDLLGLQTDKKAPFFPPPRPEDSVSAGMLSWKQVSTRVSAMWPIGESGLSKILGVGGIFVRKPALKYVAAGGAVVIVILAVVIAILSGKGSQSTGTDPSVVAAETRASGDLDPDEQARLEAQRWFGSDRGTRQKVRVEPSDPNGAKAGKAAPFRGRRPDPAEDNDNDSVAPPPLAPPPAAFKEADKERVVRRVLPERRAERVSTGGGQSNAPSASQLSQISAVIGNAQNQKAVQSCYNRVLRRLGDRTGGRMEVLVSIGPAGRVKEVNLSSPPGLKPVHDCIKQAVSLWRFPGGPEAYSTSFTLVLQGT